MEYIVGTGLALLVGVFATRSGLDRDRAFYPTVLIASASYYDLFAVVGNAPASLGAETLVLAAFVGVALLGFRGNLWMVVAAFLGHGLFDLFHGRLIDHPGVPAWWPGFCMTYDLAAAAYLAVLLMLSKAGRSDWSGGVKTSFAKRIQPYVAAELSAAKNFESAGDVTTAFRHLERAHVLGQSATILHVRVHLQMLLMASRQRDGREVLGQIVRIAGAATKTSIGLVPRGNTGGANVSPFRAMPVSRELAEMIASASRPALTLTFCAILALGLGVSGQGRASGTSDVRKAKVGDQTVAYSVAGSNRPAVVMISGLGDGLATFKDVAPTLAAQATVITYDRAGYGQSDAPDSAKDAAAAERELLGVLKNSGVPGPYVLVGHSLGGLFAEYFAAKHPHMVAGMILEESRSAKYASTCEAAKLGACSPPPALARFMPKGAQAEVAGLAATEAQVDAAGQVKGKPVLVLSRPLGASPKPMDQLWAQTQDDLAARYGGAVHLNSPSGGHYIHLDSKAWFIGVVGTFLKSLPAAEQKK